jgi:hypothetical protein
MLYDERIQKLALDVDEFMLMEGTVEIVRTEMKKDFEGCVMKLIADWNEKEEVVPPTVVMLKYTAQKEKSRLVNSYARGAARVALKRVSRALTWIFEQTSARFRGLTLCVCVCVCMEDRIDWMVEISRVWSGLQLRVGESGVICKTHNKNEVSIRLRGVQDLPRYAPGYSYQTENMREGLMLGNGRRLRDQCTLDEDFVECLELDYRECLLIGTPQEVVMRALKRLPKYISGTEKEWQQKKKQIRKNLREMSAKDAERDGGGR